MKDRIRSFEYWGFALFLFIFLGVPLSHAQNLPTVAIISTGGTIAEKIDPKTGGAVPALTGKDLLGAVPGLGQIAHIKMINFMNIDSSHMTPEIWASLSKKVDEVLLDPEIKGVVITHGTDSMTEGSFFLDITLKTKKPVVFVGAMRNASDISPDGPSNIYNAVIQACSDEANDWGVTVTLNQYINSAWDVRKTQSYNVQTFMSREKGYLGYIVQGKVYRLNDRIHRVTLPIPEKMPEVALLKSYAGDDGRFIRYAVNEGAEGIVVEGVGSGNVNADVYGAILYALKKRVAVVLTTRVDYGGVWPMYGDVGGGTTLKKAGVIFGDNFTGPKARLMLMLALPEVSGDFDKLNKYFKR